MNFARVPITVQILALMAFGILTTAAALLAITFAGPPPRQAPAHLTEVARALAGNPGASKRFVLEQVQAKPKPVGELVVRPSLADILAEQLGENPQNVLVFAHGRPRPGGAVHGEVERDLPPGEFLVARRVSDRSWQTLRMGQDAEFSRWKWLTTLTIGGIALGAMLLAWIASRGITGPIRQLAEVARSSRSGAPLVFRIPSGPPEVAEAVFALQEFTRRNEEMTQQRLAMMLAMAHDIGTPLTRLAFRNEQLPDASREAALRDILMIRQLLSDSLLLARGWQGVDATVDLVALCRSIASREQGAGRKVAMHAESDAHIRGHALSLERMIQNIVDNAIRYGAEAEIWLESAGGTITLSVADRGPGFPDLPQADLLKPFVRGEASRNAETGGSGLGLAIVAQVVAQIGGTIVLGRGRNGGGLVTVTLPQAIFPADTKTPDP